MNQITLVDIPSFLFLQLMVVIWVLWRMNGQLSRASEAITEIKKNHLPHIWKEIARLNDIIVEHFKPHEEQK